MGHSPEDRNNDGDSESASQNDGSKAALGGATLKEENPMGR